MFTALRVVSRHIGAGYVCIAVWPWHDIVEACAQEYGARPLKRAITRLVDDPLSDAILGGVLAEGDVASMDVDASGNVAVTALHPGDAPILKSEIVDSSSLLKKKSDIIINA
jgi:ATP-dependent Clp protease ATP-binding subunit ClpC